MQKARKYIAEPNHVREVSLAGTADLPYWKRWLEKEDLIPTESDGKAQLLIIAAAMKYMGIKFQELSFSVLVSTAEVGAQKDAVYLVRAFNSSRLFTFCEQVIFSTPYCHGDVRISASFPFAVHVVKNGELVFGRRCKLTPPGWNDRLHIMERMAGKGLSSCPELRAGKAAKARCSLPGSEAIPRHIRSFTPKIR